MLNVQSGRVQQPNVAHTVESVLQRCKGGALGKKHEHSVKTFI
jgi:hypothetical protein